jgi:hypothetical protein
MAADTAWLSLLGVVGESKVRLSGCLPTLLLISGTIFAIYRVGEQKAARHRH